MTKQTFGLIESISIILCFLNCELQGIIVSFIFIWRSSYSIWVNSFIKDVLRNIAVNIISKIDIMHPIKWDHIFIVSFEHTNNEWRTILKVWQLIR